MKYLFGDSIDRNISLQVLFSLMLVIISIGLIDLVFSVLSEMTDVSESYTLKDVIIYSLLKTPYSLYNLSPYLCLIGVLVGLGNLNDQGEIIASQSLGKTNVSILISSLRPVLLIMILGLISSEYWLPDLSQKAEEERLIKQDIIKIDQGYWLVDDKEFSYFSSSPANNSIKDIKIYVFDSSFELKQVIKGSKAILIGDKWQIEDASVEGFTDSNTSGVEKNKIWKSGPKEEDFNLILSPKYFPLSSLYSQMHKDASEYRRDFLALEFWRKVLKPFVSLALIVLATTFIFGPMRNQKSGQRILLGIVLAFSINILQSLFESISVVSKLDPLFAVLIPIFFIFFMSIILTQWFKLHS